MLGLTVYIHTLLQLLTLYFSSILPKEWECSWRTFLTPGEVVYLAINGTNCKTHKYNSLNLFHKSTSPYLHVPKMFSAIPMSLDKTGNGMEGEGKMERDSNLNHFRLKHSTCVYFTNMKM